MDAKQYPRRIISDLDNGKVWQKGAFMNGDATQPTTADLATSIKEGLQKAVDLSWGEDTIIEGAKEDFETYRARLEALETENAKLRAFVESVTNLGFPAGNFATYQAMVERTNKYMLEYRQQAAALLKELKGESTPER